MGSTRMDRLDQQSQRAMAQAGRSIRRDLKSIYGSPLQAEQAIRLAMEMPKKIEAWAESATGESFRFSDLPAPMREQALQSMAAAYLVAVEEQPDDQAPNSTSEKNLVPNFTEKQPESTEASASLSLQCPHGYNPSLCWECSEKKLDIL
jgi:hypothetical protein